MRKIIFILFVLILSVGAKAATFTVTNTADSGAGSLRQAIVSANSAPGDDVINFQPGLSGTITLTSGELLISSNIAINGANTIVVSGNGQSRVFNVAAGTVSNISNLTVTGGFIPLVPMSGCGFGVSNSGNLSLSNLRIIGNIAEHSGCGLGISNTGTMALINSNVSGNTSTPIMGYYVIGAGIHNTGNLTVSNSTVSGNIARIGGGIYNTGALTITNSTIYGNFAGSTTGSEAGIAQESGGSLVMRNSTVANNAANGTGGGIISTSDSTVTLYNTIVAQNTAQLPTAGTLSDVTGTVISLGNNLVSSSSLSSGWTASDLLNINPQLAPLGNYGGQTPTAPLYSYSPAINAGNNADAPITDQRGFPRIVGGVIDIGAYESETFPPSNGVFGGRVLSPDQRGVPRAIVTLTSSIGEVRYAFTNPFGYFNFKTLPAGINYTFRVQHKRYTFTPQTVFISNNIADLKFTVFDK